MDKSRYCYKRNKVGSLDANPLSPRNNTRWGGYSSIKTQFPPLQDGRVCRCCANVQLHREKRMEGEDEYWSAQ